MRRRFITLLYREPVSPALPNDARVIRISVARDECGMRGDERRDQNFFIPFKTHPDVAHEKYIDHQLRGVFLRFPLASPLPAPLLTHFLPPPSIINHAASSRIVGTTNVYITANNRGESVHTVHAILKRCDIKTRVEINFIGFWTPSRKTLLLSFRRISFY